MAARTYVPDSLRSAGARLRQTIHAPLERLSRAEFVRTWCAIAYLFPGLHPDEFDAPSSGWPRILNRVAAEAWRRRNTGRFSESELYPCEAQWAGIFDRMSVHTSVEIARRIAQRAQWGDRAHVCSRMLAGNGGDPLA